MSRQLLSKQTALGRVMRMAKAFFLHWFHFKPAPHESAW
jgi:hypothetical protein